MAVSLVRVGEEAGELEWVLLCDDSIGSFAQAREKAWHYATRWLIEEFPKALKNRIKALGQGWGLSACNCVRPTACLRPWRCSA